MKTHKNLKILFLSLVFSAVALPVYADVTIGIDMNPFFVKGEKVSFSYTILSDKDEQITYIVSAKCPNAPIPLLELESVQLKENEPFKKEYEYFGIVSSFIEPQICKAFVSIIEPFEKGETKNFSITIDPSFSFEILLDKKVFIKNQDIDIDYNSEVENPKITAILTYPDKTTQQIILPAQIKAEQLGTYTLETTASKQGYKTITKKTQFGVIEKEVVISYAPVGASAKRQPLSDTFKLILAGAVVLTVIIGLTVFFRRKKHSGFVPPTDNV